MYGVGGEAARLGLGAGDELSGSQGRTNTALAGGPGQCPLLSSHHHPRNGQGDRRPRGTGCRASRAVIWDCAWAMASRAVTGAGGNKDCKSMGDAGELPMHAPIGSTWMSWLPTQHTLPTY